MKKNYQKLVEIMGWEKFNGETDEECQEKVNKCLTALRKMMEE